MFDIASIHEAGLIVWSSWLDKLCHCNLCTWTSSSSHLIKLACQWAVFILTS